MLLSKSTDIENSRSLYFHARKYAMNKGSKAAGRVRQPSGYVAFVPAPLPPELYWTPEMSRALSDADRLIGRLAGEGGRLPNPHLLIRPFGRREAVLSSRIEGTQTTLGELLAAEAGAVVERSPEDLREVGNYVAALEYGVRRLKKLPLSLRLVRELHAKLMAGVGGGQAAPRVSPLPKLDRSCGLYAGDGDVYPPATRRHDDLPRAVGGIPA